MQAVTPQDMNKYTDISNARGYAMKSNNHLCLKLHKSLYGMIVALLLCFKALCKALVEEGFVQSTADPCLFLHLKKNIIIITYVDDCLLFCEDPTTLEILITSLKGKHPLTDENIGNDMYDYLGIEITMKDRKINLLQSGLINKILTTTGYNKVNPSVKTPAKESPLTTDTDGLSFDGDYDYPTVVGMLLYLVNTCPDIQYAVHSCCCFVHCPRKSHDVAIRRICRYLISTKNKGLTFNLDNDPLQLHCYVDADFCGLHKYETHVDPISSKSHTGYVILSGKSLISWCSKLQTETALSSTESEIVALSTCMRETLWIQRLVKDISRGFGINTH